MAFVFLMVWYYCTLTIRESILRVNGSRIKGWWRAHHFISTALSAVLLTWPDSTTYHQFRHQLMWFYVYISDKINKLYFTKNFILKFLLFQVLYSTFNSDTSKAACIVSKHWENDTIWILPLRVSIRGCGEDLAFCSLFSI